MRNLLFKVFIAAGKLILSLLFIGSFCVAAKYGLVWIIALCVVIFAGFMLSTFDWRKLWNNWKK